MKKLLGVLLVLFYSCTTTNDGNTTKTTVVPIPPTNLVATLSPLITVNLSWIDNSTNETGFKIERKVSGGEYTLIGTTDADKTTFSDSGLSLGVTYTYRVYAYNSVGSSLTYAYLLEIKTANIPILTTTLATLTIVGSASSGGNITDNGGSDVTVRGVVWSTNSSPTIDLSTKTIDGSGNGVFTSAITGLTAGTTYYVRAYATNSAGTAYGQEISFKTLTLTAPTLSSSPIINIKSTNAQGGGNITSDGGSAIISRGVVWSTSSNPTISLSTKTSDGSGIGSFSSNISSLLLNVKYYVRAFATNSVGTSYGNEISFTTSYAIGETGPANGFIFYDKGVFSNGWRYLEANYADYSSGIVWWNGTWTYQSVVGISPNTGLGDGKTNTLLIIAANNNLNNAAKVCNDYVHNGFTDWYLPSKDELELMCQNLYKEGKGNFSNNFYWSSTDTSRIHNAHWNQFMSKECSPRTDSGRNMSNLVRPIRQF